MTAVTERYHTQRKVKSGFRESNRSGTPTITSRRNEAMSGGIVLPMAWNMLDPTKMIPDATKLQDTMRKYSAPTATTLGSFEKKRIIAAAARWQTTAKTSMPPPARAAADPNVLRTR